MSESFYYILAAGAWVALCLRGPALLRASRNPLQICVALVLLLSGALHFVSNPSVIRRVNAMTGVVNATAPLAYALLTLSSAAILTLVLYWRGGPGRAAQRTARWCLSAYGLAALAVFVLFALGDTPVERTLDFEVYYANTPYIREMAVLYLVSHATAGVWSTTSCWRWFTGVSEPVWLRRGLRILIVGFLSSLVFDVVKLTGIAARWTGTDWDFLIVKVAPPLSLLSTVGVVTGFILPLVGPRLSSRTADVRTFLRLRPLWKALCAATPAVAASVPLPWWAVDLRLTRRVAEIHDGRLALREYRDPAVAAAAAAQAREAGLPSEEADAVVEAAVLAAAMELKRRSPHSPAQLTGLASASEATPLRRPALVRISRALDRSPVVAAAARKCRCDEEQEAPAHGSAE